MLETPVLFIIFNRPDLERRVLERIREVKPKQLFVVADGPRLDRLDDLEKCKQARALIDELVDWECELYKNYSDVNLGCRERVSSGITWFFEHVEEGIILEDDCLPSKEGILFLCEKLFYYKEKKEVSSITLVSKLESRIKLYKDSYKSKYSGIWGWATWADRWKNFKEKKYKKNDLIKEIENNFKTQLEIKYNLSIAEKTFSNNYDSWGYFWRAYHLIEKKYCIRPSVNLVENIGFTKEATHTTDLQIIDFSNKAVQEIDMKNNVLKYSKFIDFMHVANKINMNSSLFRVRLLFFNLKNSYSKSY